MARYAETLKMSLLGSEQLTVVNMQSLRALGLKC